MNVLINDGYIWGASPNKSNPFVDLKTLTDFLPDATNNAYMINAHDDKHVILDIEPICPQNIKDDLLKLPYVYGEISMSGKGFHLVFPLSNELWDKYPAIHNKKKLQRKDRYYEILLDHMITFTRKTIPFPDSSNVKDIKEFDNILEDLAKSTIVTAVPTECILIDDINTDDIPQYAKTISVLSAQIYDKKPIDFYDDMSRYEFGMASFYHHKLRSLQKHYSYKNAQYSDEQKAIIIYKLLLSKLEPRAKHMTSRRNMPYLLYIATDIIARYNAEHNSNKSKSAKQGEKDESASDTV